MRKRQIYVIQSECGRVKIGSSLNPESRARAIRQHSPTLTRLIARWPGDVADELALHKHLNASRHHNEWFLPTVQISDFVAEVFGRGVTNVPDWRDIAWVSKAERHAEKSAQQAEKMRAVWRNAENREAWIRNIQAGRRSSVGSA